MVNSDNICFEICGNIFRRFSKISPVVQAVQTEMDDLSLQFRKVFCDQR